MKTVYEKASEEIGSGDRERVYIPDLDYVDVLIWRAKRNDEVAFRFLFNIFRHGMNSVEHDEDIDVVEKVKVHFPEIAEMYKHRWVGGRKRPR